MYQKSGKIEHMYNNQTSQQKQSELQTGNNEYRFKNPNLDSQIRYTNRELFMQGGTNSTMKDHQKPKIFDTQNQSSAIKNNQFVTRFPFQIPNSPQCDRQDQKPNDNVKKCYTTNINGSQQMPYNNQHNNNYYQQRMVQIEQQSDINQTLPINHQIYSYDVAQQMESKYKNSFSQEQNKKSEQKYNGNTVPFYDQLVEQKDQFQEVLIKSKFEDHQKQSHDQIKHQYVEQSIIISECNLMELKNREISTIKNFQKTIGIIKTENQKESPNKQYIEVEKIQSQPINEIVLQNQKSIDQTQTGNKLIETIKVNCIENLQCQETMEVVKFYDDDDEKNIEEPVKVSNFVTAKIQQRGEKQLQQFNQVNQPSQRCSALEFEVLEKMNQVRQNRLNGMKVDYFGVVEILEKSDCITDLVAEKSIIQLIITQFPYLRRVRGDGNCLFSSLLFPYLELIYINNLFDAVLNQFVAHEIYWNKATMIDRPMVFTLIKKIFQELKKFSKKYSNDLILFSELILHYINKINGFYDILIIFMRSTIIQSYKLYSKQGEYQYFLDENTSEEFLEKNSSFEEEGDFLSIQFFCEITQLKVKLINFSDKHPIQSMQILEPKINKVRNDQNNFITLKYNEGHYDILYSRMLKQMQIKQEERPLPQIQFTPLY
ncbi:unnamed protein product [Paramecium primaurelia]|uniref:Uncharacterized protein n=1 Tax=Paramecium primaurelia TaxID=5886 RepID=A0A8S1MY60_PARPR|nr:unnamed protein product [Paramecium primaurelia]